MAVMSAADRADATIRWIRRTYVELQGTASVDTVSIRAAVDAIDQWCEDNTTSFNTALPEPFKSTATSAQKALLLAFVAMKRTGVL